MTHRLTQWSLCAAAASALAFGAPAVAAPSLGSTTVLSGLDNPWDMAFLPDGTMFFTEKCRGLSVRLPSGEINKLHGMRGSEGYASADDDLFCEGQAGMMGAPSTPPSTRTAASTSTRPRASPNPAPTA